MRIIKIKNKDNYPYITLNLAFLLYPSILKESIIVDWSVIDPYNDLLPVIGYPTITSRHPTVTSRISGEIRPMPCEHKIIVANNHHSTILFSLFWLILVYSDRYYAARRILTVVLLYFITKTDT